MNLYRSVRFIIWLHTLSFQHAVMLLVVPMLAVSVLLAYLLLKELNKEEKRKQRRGETTSYCTSVPFTVSVLTEEPHDTHMYVILYSVAKLMTHA